MQSYQTNAKTKMDDITKKSDIYMCNRVRVFVNRMMWAAGAVAAMSSITFPAVSALVSQSADPDKQGEKKILALFHLHCLFSSSFTFLLFLLSTISSHLLCFLSSPLAPLLSHLFSVSSPLSPLLSLLLSPLLYLLSFTFSSLILSLPQINRSVC